MSGVYWPAEVCSALTFSGFHLVTNWSLFRTLFFFFFFRAGLSFPHFHEQLTLPSELLIKELSSKPLAKQKATFTMLGGGEERKNRPKKPQISFQSVGSVVQLKFTLIRNHLEALQEIESSAGSASWQVAQHKATPQLPNPLFDLCKPSLLLTLFNEVCASPGLPAERRAPFQICSLCSGVNPSVPRWGNVKTGI